MSLLKLPLHDDIEPNIQVNPNANFGLWFERYFNFYNNDWLVEPDSKSNFLEVFSSNVGSSTMGDAANLKSFSVRQHALAVSQQGKSGVMKADWHWVTGLGNSHTVETGLTWHRTLAAPYLPGSSVKGLVRAWLEQQDDPDKAKIHQWFGSESKDPKHCTERETQGGQVIFFDATPFTPVEIHLDVMTPHNNKWLMEENPTLDSAPGDWNEPIPVFFLSCKNTKLHFSIAKAQHADDSLNIDEVWQALEESLDYLGVGAKTGAGYGYMSPAESDTKSIQRESKKVQAENSDDPLFMSFELTLSALLEDNSKTAKTKFVKSVNELVNDFTNVNPENHSALRQHVEGYISKFDKASKEGKALKKLNKTLNDE